MKEAVIIPLFDHFEPMIVGSLPYEKDIVYIVFTTGQGDSRDSFKEFWRFLLQENLGNSWFLRVCFAVFWLGDSGYQKYKFVAKNLDKRLLHLGATIIIEKGLGDDQHPAGYGTVEETLDPWMLPLWSMVYQIKPKYFPKGPEGAILDIFVDWCYLRRIIDYSL
ncbi:unnamed protein product [Eruca vesicaria subsp. sativa]|uniref:Flavodoxin-like domain-containing protein n=1 Tax=Eruca vesicaria subsp. sativa TaxID=29727 RepID=A0ABC8JUW4_ERUVS|nr:unnamed protein product [Eruca vesicaria subsp. sativa]